MKIWDKYSGIAGLQDHDDLLDRCFASSDEGKGAPEDMWAEK